MGPYVVDVQGGIDSRPVSFLRMLADLRAKRLDDSSRGASTPPKRGPPRLAQRSSRAPVDTRVALASARRRTYVPPAALAGHSRPHGPDRLCPTEVDQSDEKSQASPRLGGAQGLQSPGCKGIRQQQPGHGGGGREGKAGGNRAAGRGGCRCSGGVKSSVGPGSPLQDAIF